ncbi:response regulator [Maritimibacter dapengensis]|uniref:Response regulator n=1 Tax=Maritimibacter dapengensis TaxID=2836868 RepID=A0ABS6SXZ4_9RHOB|nr:response regulator [Maritimibacter dapengensis]MBV7377774.1 response regulator [Maritimibacter dapengensis]
MDDDLTSLSPKPSRDRPLAGMSVLLVEDSRYASEAIRLLCLKSGARIRRADCLASAHRHLSVYRPAVVVVDMGLPDGSGAELISELCGHAGGPVVLGLSGDRDAEQVALDAGADGFLAKPVDSLAAFQQIVLSAAAPEMRPMGPRPIARTEVFHDPAALAEDLLNAADLLKDAKESGEFEYLAHFLRGVALSSRDTELGAACDALAEGPGPALWRVEKLLRNRIAASA